MLGIASSNVGASAVQWARCPICFEALHSRPHEVGALVFEKRRIESALYHKSCMLDEQGKLRLSASLTPPWHRSPISRQEIDGFELMPPIRNTKSWTKFVDWNCDGKVDVCELAIVIAATLPVDEHEAEKLVSKKFDKDSNGFLDTKEICKHVIPYIRTHTSALIARTKLPPDICNSSSVQEFSEWFDFWDKDQKGYMSQSSLLVAISTCFESETADLRSRISRIILDEAGFYPDETVLKRLYQTRIVPLLQVNLPCRHDCERDNITELARPYDPKQPVKIKLLSSNGRKKDIEVSPAATVGEMRSEVRRQFRVWLGAKDADLCVSGRVLLDDSATLLSLPVNLGEAVFQVLPKIKVEYVSIAKADGADSETCCSNYDGDSDSSSEDDNE